MLKKQITYEQIRNIIYCYFQSNFKKERKLIGTIDQIYKKLSIKISQQDDTFRSTMIIEINSDLLKLTDYDTIEVQVGEYCYETTRIFFIENSELKYFPGNEIKKVMSRDLFGVDKAEEWEWNKIKKLKKVVNY